MKRQPQFQVYPTTDDSIPCYRWRLRAANGEIVAQGESHGEAISMLAG